MYRLAGPVTVFGCAVNINGLRHKLYDQKHKQITQNNYKILCFFHKRYDNTHYHAVFWKHIILNKKPISI